MQLLSVTLLLPFVLFQCLVDCTHAISWQEGCMCQMMKREGTDISQSKIFGTTFYRHDGAISSFCDCSISSVQKLNEVHIAQQLEAILATPFFRYFRVDLEAECPFWKDEGYCTIKQCSVDEEAEDKVSESLGSADTSRGEGHDLIDEHWDAEELDSSWTNEGENKDFHYIDLLANPEKYTGYKPRAGSSRVWHEIHAYNTFHSSSSKIGSVGNEGEESPSELASMPVEHRLFWKSVSGLHASISSHIAVNYLLDSKDDIWGLDLDEFRRRLGDHPDRVNNLHFVYLLELRAVAILGQHLVQADHSLSTGHPDEDRHTMGLLQSFLASKSKWPVSFEEETAFHGDADHQMLQQFREKMHNISRIMDCVGCQRCRLWGKLQIMGLGTALRILYSPHRDDTIKSLHRSHIVALFNALGRLSHSVEATRLVVPLLSQVSTGILGKKESKYEDNEEDNDAQGDLHQHNDHTFSFDKFEFAKRSGHFGL